MQRRIRIILLLAACHLPVVVLSPVLDAEASGRVLPGWLERHQSPDGRWDGDGFTAMCGRHAEFPGRCDGRRIPGFDVGLTALALESFLAGGETHQDGDRRETVGRAIRWLLSCQQADGSFRAPDEREQRLDLLNQALAAFALAEVYVMTGDRELRGPVQRAVDMLVASRLPDGGWGHPPPPWDRGDASGEGPGNEDSVSPPESRSDALSTCLVVFALKVATHAEGIEFPAEACFDGANRFLDGIYREDGGGRGGFGFTSPVRFLDGEPFLTTAAGTVVRQLTGEPRGLPRVVRTLRERRLDWDRCDLVEWYLLLLVWWQIGGEEMSAWGGTLKDSLLDHAYPAESFCAGGSWDPVGRWGHLGGRVFSTAMASLCLDVSYRMRR